MPIEFRCPSCSKLLRTPDESAGKRAKCPQCGTIVDVPGAASAGMSAVPPSSPSPFGTPDPSPFAPDSAFGIPPAKPFAEDPAALNPYATPASAGTAVSMRDGVDEVPRTGLPWEVGPKSAKTFWATAKLILSSPTEAFNLMYRSGGVGTPIGFLMVGGLIGGLFSGFYNTAMQAALLSFVTAAGGQNNADMMTVQWVQVAMQLPVAIAGGTIGAMIGSFITAGIFHLFLMMLGGARFEYETTYRSVAYVSGAVALLNAIPVCGQYAIILVSVIYWILALSATQRISGGKASAAVLLPFGLCFFVVILAFGAIIATVGFAAAQ